MARVEMPNSFARSAMANSSALSASILFTSGPFAPGPFIVVSQLVLGQLTDHGLGQLVPEDDFARHFELGEVFLQEGLEVTFAEGLPFVKLDIGHRSLAAIFVLYADDVGLVYRRVLVNRIFDGA